MTWATNKSPSSRFVLEGSHRTAASGTVMGPTAPHTEISVSVFLTRKTPLKLEQRGPSLVPMRISRAEYMTHHSADPVALQLVEDFAQDYKLTVKTDPSSTLRRTLQLVGSAANMQRAFGVELKQKLIGAIEHRTREGAITLPKQLQGAVEAVLGLDDRPQTTPHFRIRKPHTDVAGYTPLQIAQLYGFRPAASGVGQTIGIIELGGGYRVADLTAYFKMLLQHAPSISAVPIDGGKNAPSNANSADTEVMLDIEIPGSIAPGAKLALYFAPNTDQGFIDAVSAAVHDTANKPSVISISWGGPESSWTMQAMKALDAVCQSAAALGVTVIASAGDQGSSDGVRGKHVDFPASSPHVLACGGTRLIGAGSVITSETVWNDTFSHEGATGGGVSGVFAEPLWQATANVPRRTDSLGGRGVPDVAGNADPNTGYTIRVDGKMLVIGGTSAVAPLWAGLVAIANCQLGTNVGLIQPTLYSRKAAVSFNDIVKGNNGEYSAGPGWDPCTGLGSPRANKLIPLLIHSISSSALNAQRMGTTNNTFQRHAKLVASRC